MAENLVKDARYRMTRKLSLSNSRELQKVDIKVVKIERINKQQLSTPNLKQQNMSLILRKDEDLYKGKKMNTKLKLCCYWLNKCLHVVSNLFLNLKKSLVVSLYFPHRI